MWWFSFSAQGGCTRMSILLKGRKYWSKSSGEFFFLKDKEIMGPSWGKLNPTVTTISWQMFCMLDKLEYRFRKTRITACSVDVCKGSSRSILSRKDLYEIIGQSQCILLLGITSYIIQTGSSPRMSRLRYHLFGNDISPSSCHVVYQRELELRTCQE